MTKLIKILPLMLGLLTATSQAGETVVSSGKESKAFKETPVDTCFNDHEFQIDLFGQYSVGEGPHQAGVGLEYRIKPHKLGFFVDGRWTYLGDRDERSDLNFFSARAGFRIVF